MFGALSSFLSSFTWAIGTSTYGRLSRDHSPFAVNFTRALVAFPLFAICAIVFGGGVGPLLAALAGLEGWRLAWLLVSMIASYGIGDAMFMWSTRSLGVPAALAICSCYPIWTTLAGVFALGQPIDAWRAAGVIVTLAGVVMVILSGEREGSARPAKARARHWGFAVAALSSGFWALNSVAISIGASGDVSPFLANSVRMVFAMVIAGGVGRLLTPNQSVAIPWPALKPSLWVFVLEGFGGSIFFLYGLTRAPLAVAAVLSSLAPVLSVPIAWLMGGERPTAFKTAGICVTVIGIALLAF